jgi:uncharacterized delta-60 repeat protein
LTQNIFINLIPSTMKNLYLLLFLTFSFIGKAQNPGDVLQNFGPTPGFGREVNTIAVQTDGKIIVGGELGTYNGVIENRIVRLNTDGTKDPSFNTGTGFSNTVNAIVIQPDGKIIVGGNFTTYNGVTVNRIIRLNSDGTQDTSFTTGTGFGNYVNTIALQPDGKIIVGGWFVSYNGETVNKIIRLNSDGTQDTTFITGSGINGEVFAVAVQTDGKIMVTGNFQSYNGVAANDIMRLNSDGTIDATFSSGTGFNIDVIAIAVQPDGKTIVGGRFFDYNDILENNIVRLNSDGSKDTTFITGTGFNRKVNSIVLQPDGTIIIGGSFTTYNGATASGIVRLNTDGTKDTSFTASTDIAGGVNAIALEADGKIMLGGDLRSYNGTGVGSIVRINSDGTRVVTFNTATGLNGLVNTIVAQSDGKIVVGGDFTTYKGESEKYITRINSDGTKDTAFTSGTGFDNAVNAVALQPDGKIIVGGRFTTYKDATENRIIRLNSDGTKDASFTTGTGFTGGFSPSVETIAVQDDGKIIVGGRFTAYNGETANRIVRLNSDGTKDATFTIGTGFNNTVFTILMQTDGKIIVGGIYASYNGVAASRIIRLNNDGTKDATFSTGTGFNGTINTIALQPDGKMMLGGSFTAYDGATANQIIRLNSDGTQDTTFNTGTGFEGAGFVSSVESIALESDGKIIVGGRFSTYQDITANGIIRLNSDGTKDTSFSTGTDFNNTFNGVNAIALKSDGKILVGGNFTTYNDSAASAYLIGLNSLACPAFTPTFTQVAPICSGAILAALPTTSTNEISGTWLPELNNLATTTYIFTPTAGQCATTATMTITVNPNVTPTFTQVEPICSGATLAALPTSSTNGINGTWLPELNNLETTAYTFTPTAGVCATTATVTITVNPNETPTFTQVEPICSGATLANLPTTSNNTITGTWSPELDNTVTTTYTFTPSAGQCVSTTAVTMTIEVGTTKTWTEDVWSPSAPTSVDAAVIAANYSQAADITACSLTINNNATVSIPSGFNVSLIDIITVEEGSSFTLENDATLRQTTTAANVGTSTVKRNSTPLFRLDYTLWSSPVSGQNLRAFSPATLFNRFSSYNTGGGTGNGAYLQEIVTVADMNTKTFTNAKGYLIRMPNNWVTWTLGEPVPASFEATYTGTLNNGTVSIPLSGANARFNLVGNPYPSPILIADFLAANTNITATMYFWRKQASANTDNLNSGFATLNNMGWTYPADLSIVQPVSIQTGQGFFVEANSAEPGNLIFNNEMRVNNNPIFFRNSNSSTELHRMWLNLSSATNIVGQTLIGYKTGATQGVDSGIDALYFNDSDVALTSLIDNNEYIIQGRSVPFMNTDIVPLGFKTDVAGSYTISLSNFDGLFAGNQDIFLKDNVAGTVHNLKIADYPFATQAGVFNTRFEVQYTNVTLGSNNPLAGNNSILIGVKDQKININAGSVVMEKIELIDVIGRVIFTQQGVNSTTATLDNVVLANQMLVVRITTAENAVVTQKIIF